MAASVNSRRNSCGFMTQLSSAACEWFLMFLMFVYAALSYLLTKFACYCELQTPCLLCSRLDHVFRKEPGYYRILLCSDHREEISSTIYCHIHDKLADVRKMCEECFMSIAMQNKPSPESYKLMVGKLGFDFERCGFQSSYVKKNFVTPYSGTRSCVCCNKPLKNKTNAQRLIQLTPAGLGASRANVRPPLPRVPGRSRLSHRDNLKRMRDKISGSATSPRGETAAEKMMSNVGYSELKFNSESESEVPFSDDDDGSSNCHEKFDSNESFLAQLGSSNLAKKETDRLNLMKMFQQVDLKSSLSTQPELIPSSSRTIEGPSGVSAEKLTSDRMLLKVAPSKSGSAETPLEAPSKKESNVDATRADFSNEAASLNNEDLTDVSSTIVTNQGKDASGLLAAQDANSDSVNVGKTVKFQPPISDASNSEGIRATKMSCSLDELDSSYESADISNVDEIDGESIVDRLKRQIDYDRKCMSSLYRELEEERNASAISANQAMAMITKLQEEKAALQMDSLQYLRMMEEQAEYDMEALNKANDLLAEKEFEIQELEIELEFYRNNLDEPTLEDVPSKTSNLKRENKKVSNNDVEFIDSDANVPSESRSSQLDEGGEKSTNVPSDSGSSHLYEGGEKATCARSCFLDLEEEKKYIAQCLKDLERKLQQVCTDAASSGMQGTENITNRVESRVENCTDREAKADSQNKNGSISKQETAAILNGSPSSHDENCPSVDKHLKGQADQKMSSQLSGKFDLDTLENEISDLNDRLEALEIDHDFLEHSFNTVRGGNDGLQFLGEIANHLQELRKFEFGGR